MFSGTDNSNGCAFEQRLTLPQNGKKQYTMTIPYADVSQTRGNGIVAFIDEKGNVVAKEAFASIFGKEKRGIGVGVLSDHYDALGWMSMSRPDLLSSRKRPECISDTDGRGYIAGAAG